MPPPLPARAAHDEHSAPGRRAHPTEYDDGGFLVMADREGNEFRVIPDGPFELDDGRAHHLG
ncbi:hypothetical protein [Streptomyces sp. NBC_00566]|uniref:hypothetical protein n=1 Tax=Streptomyces sp. NBC_00566 TaxID=2975778 RepID=UPI003FCD8E6B